MTEVQKYKSLEIEEQDLNVMLQFIEMIKSTLDSNLRRLSKENKAKRKRYFYSNGNFYLEQFFYVKYQWYDGLTTPIEKLDLYVRYLKDVVIFREEMKDKIQKAYDCVEENDYNYRRNHDLDNEIVDILLVDVLFRAPSSDLKKKQRIRKRKPSSAIIHFEKFMIEAWRKWMTENEILNEFSEANANACPEVCEVMVDNKKIYEELVEKIMYIKNCLRGGKYYYVTDYFLLHNAVQIRGVVGELRKMKHSIFTIPLINELLCKFEVQVNINYESLSEGETYESLSERETDEV